MMFNIIMLIINLCQVHKIIPGSLADRDGRIQKGDRVLSINGRTLRGVTHREALAILKVRPTALTILNGSPVGPRHTHRVTSYLVHSMGVLRKVDVS